MNCQFYIFDEKALMKAMHLKIDEKYEWTNFHQIHQSFLLSKFYAIRYIH